MKTIQRVRNALTRAVIFTLCLISCAAFITEAFAAQELRYEGNGTTDNPFRISAPEQLAGLIGHGASYSYELTSDIDLSNYIEGHGAWTPLGDTETPFCGAFDGNGFTVYGLIVSNTAGNNGGLFGVLKGAKISGLNIAGVNVTADGANAGAVAGSAVESVIDDCRVSGYIAGNIAGGIVGEAVDTVISGSYNTASVTGIGGAGGIAGETVRSDITGCRSRADKIASEESAAGGVAGFAETSDISGCYSYGVVKGVMSAGGIVGEADIGTFIEGCVAAGGTGDGIAAPSGSAGGIAGSIVNSHAMDCVSGIRASGAHAGGIAGRLIVDNETPAPYMATIRDCVTLNSSIIGVYNTIPAVSYSVGAGDLNESFHSIAYEMLSENYFVQTVFNIMSNSRLPEPEPVEVFGSAYNRFGQGISGSDAIALKAKLSINSVDWS